MLFETIGGNGPVVRKVRRLKDANFDTATFMMLWLALVLVPVSILVVAIIWMQRRSEEWWKRILLHQIWYAIMGLSVTVWTYIWSTTSYPEQQTCEVTIPIVFYYLAACSVALQLEDRHRGTSMIVIVIFL